MGTTRVSLYALCATVAALLLLYATMWTSAVRAPPSPPAAPALAEPPDTKQRLIAELKLQPNADSPMPIPRGSPACETPTLKPDNVSCRHFAGDPPQPFVDVVVTSCGPLPWLADFATQAVPPPFKMMRVFVYRPSCPQVPLPRVGSPHWVVHCDVPALWNEVSGFLGYLRKADRRAAATVFLQDCPYTFTCDLHATVRAFLAAPTPHGYLALGNRLVWPKCQPAFDPFLPLTCDTHIPGGDRVQAWCCSQFVVTARVLERTPPQYWDRVQCLFEEKFSASPERQVAGAYALESQWHMMFGFRQQGSFLGPNRTHSAPLLAPGALPLRRPAAERLACLFSVDRATPEGYVSVRGLSFAEFKQLSPALRRLNGSRVQKWHMYGNNRFVKSARADVPLGSIVPGMALRNLLHCGDQCSPEHAGPRGLPVTHCHAPLQ